MKRVLLVLLLLLLVVGGLTVWRAYGPISIANRDDCGRIAGRKLRIWRLLQWNTARIERAYQRELAACLGADSASSGLIGAANFDYARLGRQLLSGNVEPDAYLARVRDRSRKLRIARTVPGWSDSFAHGDRDGDLVPDDRDKCHDTPDLSPTDDQGCPQTGPLPAAPSRDEIERAKQALHVAISPACRQAPPPSSSTPLQIGLDQNDPDVFYIAVSKTSDQPPDCPVFYDIRIRSERSSFFTQSSGSAHFYFVFRASENVDTSPAAQFRQVFRLRKQNVTRWNDLVATAIEPSDREDRIVEVRMVNGNGLSRGWSAPRTFSINFATRTFPPF
jgi:hypothetical protein